VAWAEAVAEARNLSRAGCRDLALGHSDIPGKRPHWLDVEAAKALDEQRIAAAQAKVVPADDRPVAGRDYPINGQRRSTWEKCFDGPDWSRLVGL
jgi:hypothetical protein